MDDRGAAERRFPIAVLNIAILFFAALVAGILLAVENPDLGTMLLDLFRETIMGGLEDASPPVLAVGIFLNNLQACILLFLGGASFGILTVIILASNGVIIGAIMEVVQQEKGTLFVAAAILPHGVFEIPAFIISGALGFMLAGSLWREWQGKEDACREAGHSARLFITIVVPIVAAAAFIEAFITPEIIHLVS
jgi:stage II sporulation protein M